VRGKIGGWKSENDERKIKCLFLINSENEIVSLFQELYSFERDLRITILMAELMRFSSFFFGAEEAVQQDQEIVMGIRSSFRKENWWLLMMMMNGEDQATRHK